jgi:hypothetical protein
MKLQSITYRKIGRRAYCVSRHQITDENAMGELLNVVPSIKLALTMYPSVQPWTGKGALCVS